MQNKIKNIIFDLGNVILDIDLDRTIVAMKKLGVDNFEDLYNLVEQDPLFDHYEKGLISSSEFRNGLRKYFNKPLSDEELDEAWGKILLDFDPKRVEFVKSLKTKYRLFLLSNTNAIHYDMYNGNLLRSFGHSLDSMFEKAYYSYRVGMRKPDTGIFEHVIKDSRLNPTDTMFIDDNQENIEAAKRTGLQTIHLNVQRGDQLTDILKRF